MLVSDSGTSVDRELIRIFYMASILLLNKKITFLRALLIYKGKEVFIEKELSIVTIVTGLVEEEKEEEVIELLKEIDFSRLLKVVEETD